MPVWIAWATPEARAVRSMLSPAECQRFADDGFLVCRGLPAGWASELLPQVEVVPAADGPTPDRALHRHLDSPAVHALAAHPEVTGRVAALLGDDLLLWHTRLFDKQPGVPPVPWHQDGAFWPLEPVLCVSAWIAIQPAHPRNGCLWMIPGSHRIRLPHHASQGGGRFGQAVDPSADQLRRAVPVCLDPGELVLFDRWVIHSSPASLTGEPRLGLAARYVPPSVRIGFARMAHAFPKLGAQLVRGGDRHRLNTLVPPPQAPAR